MRVAKQPMETGLPAWGGGIRTSAFTWQGAAALISRVLFQVYCEGWRAFRRAGTGTSNLLFHVIDGQLNVGR